MGKHDFRKEAEELAASYRDLLDSSGATFVLAKNIATLTRTAYERGVEDVMEIISGRAVHAGIKHAVDPDKTIAEARALKDKQP